MKRKLFALLLLAALASGTVGIMAATSNSGDAGDGKVPDKNITRTPVLHGFQQPPADEPGVINGAKNPELIPDVVAYSLLFRFVSGAQGAEAQKRIRHYVRQMGLGDQTCYLCSGEKEPKAKGDDRDIDAFIAAAAEFQQRVNVLDQQAIEIRKRNWPNLSTEEKAQLTRLQRQKEIIVTEIVASLPRRLRADGVNKVHAHVNERMKRRIKMPVRQDQANSQSLAKLNSNFSIQ
jgi:hypothetical protein